MAEEKSPSRISLRLFAINRSEMEIIMKNTIVIRLEEKSEYRKVENSEPERFFRKCLHEIKNCVNIFLLK